MRACEEEYDVCSSFPRSLIAESEFYTGIKGGSMNMMIDLVKMLRNVFFVPVTVDEFDTYCVRCTTKKRKRAQTEDIGNESNEGEITTETCRNVEDGMW